MVQAVQQHLVNHKRQVTEQHFLPMSSLQREACLKTNDTDQLLSNSALVDDVVVSSKDINTKEYQSLSETDQLRVHLQIHIFALETLFHAISQLSRPPGPGPIFHASVKLKLEKSSLGATSAWKSSLRSMEPTLGLCSSFHSFTPAWRHFISHNSPAILWTDFHFANI